MKKIKIFASKVIDNPENFDDIINQIPEEFSYEYLEELNPDLLEIEEPDILDKVFKGIGDAFKDAQKLR